MALAQGSWRHLLAPITTHSADCLSGYHFAYSTTNRKQPQNYPVPANSPAYVLQHSLQIPVPPSANGHKVLLMAWDALQALWRKMKTHSIFFSARTNTYKPVVAVYKWKIHIFSFILQQISIISSAADTNSDCRLFKTTILARNVFFVFTLIWMMQCIIG